jgi:hypothetical protein
MTLSEIIQDIHACEEDMLTYERKYGIRSATFYESYMQGDEPPDGATVLDWAGWAGTYEIWLERQQQYVEAIQLLRRQTPLIRIIEKAVRHDAIPIPA